MPGASFKLCWGRGLNRRRIGEKGEDVASRYLTKKGYATVERNYRTHYGEIDLVVRDESALTPC